MISDKLASFIKEVKYDNLPEEVREAAKAAIMDWLGSTVAGSREAPAGMVAAIVRRAGGSPAASLIGLEEKSSALNAALLNGVAGHILELDDLHRSSILHPGAPIISAAAAAVEEVGAGGRELITAVVAGFEVGIRIAEAVTPSHYYYWHTTGTCGTFGAAAAACRVYGLEEDEIVNALGNAGSQAAGLWEFLSDGAMTKHLHPGKAAMNGLLAAQLAGEGFTGASRILEGEKGFFRATAEEYFPEKATAGLGREYRITGNSYKIYPSCRHTHPGVDLILKLKAEGLDPSAVETILFKTYRHAVNLVGGNDYSTPYKAKFCLPYCAAKALIDGRLDLDSFDFSEAHDALLEQLAGAVTVQFDPGVEEAYPLCWGTAVEVNLKEGRTLTAETDYPKGDPENPASAAEMRDKFLYLAGLCWPEKRAHRVLEMLLGLENLEQTGDLFK